MNKFEVHEEVINLLKLITSEALGNSSVMRKSFPVNINGKAWQISYKLKNISGSSCNIVILQPSAVSGTGNPDGWGSSWIVGFGKWTSTTSEADFPCITSSSSGIWATNPSVDEWHKIDMKYIPGKGCRYFLDDTLIGTYNITINERTAFINSYTAGGNYIKDLIFLDNIDLGVDSFTKVSVTGNPYSILTVDECGNDWTNNGVTIDEEEGYLVFANNAYLSLDNFALGADSFTIDFWYNTNTSTPQYSRTFAIFSEANSDTADRIIISPRYDSSNLPCINVRLDSTNFNSTSISSSYFSWNSWVHVAVCWDKLTKTCYQFLNGNLVAKKEDFEITNHTFTHLYLGKSDHDVDGYYIGKLKNFRISTGICRWTSEFQPDRFLTDTFNTWSSSSVFLPMNGIADECGNEWIITGDITLSETNSKFGKALNIPKGSYLDNNCFIYDGGNITVDFWVNMDSSSDYYARVFECTMIGNNNCRFEFTRKESGNGFEFYAHNNTTEHWGICSTGIGTLCHFAMCYDSSTGKSACYKDGILFATMTCTFEKGIYKIRIGNGIAENRYMAGSIDEFRISNNIRWTADFTPSTAQYTKDNNTLVLLHFNNTQALKRFDDTSLGLNSENTINLDYCRDSSKWITAVPIEFTTTNAKFSQAVYLEGRQEYIKSDKTFAYTGQDFTIDCWAYENPRVYSTCLFSLYDKEWADSFAVGQQNRICIWHTAATTLYMYQTGTTATNTSCTVTLNGGLHHYALVQRSGTLYLYIDGTQKMTLAHSIPSGTDFYVFLGCDPHTPTSRALTGNEFRGWISEFRISNTARWTANFTPPTSAYSSDSSTWALLHFNGNLSDVCSNTTWSAVSIYKPVFGTQTKFGTSSLYFERGDQMVLKGGLTLGGGDFTIEGWCYFSNSSGTYARIFENIITPGSSTHGVWLYRSSTNSQLVCSVYNSSNSGASATGNISYNTWFHWAVVQDYSAGVNRFYINGNLIGTISKVIGRINRPFVIGRSSWTSDGFFVGFHEYFRIIDGIAKYKNSFIPYPLNPESIINFYVDYWSLLTIKNGKVYGVNPKSRVEIPEILETNFNYTGGVLFPTLKNCNYDKITVTNASATNAGSYNLTLALKNQADMWSDGTRENKVYTWVINRIAGSVSLSSTATLTLTPNTNVATYTCSRLGDGALSVSSNNNNVATASISGTTITVTRKGTGSCTITVSCAQGTNYTAASAGRTITCTAIDSNTLSYMKFDSIAENDLITTNTWTPQSNSSNKALYLNGSSYLQLNGGITIGGQDFTVDFWCRTTNSSGYRRMFHIGNAKNQNDITCCNNTGSGRFWMSVAGVNIVTSEDYLNRWVHVAMVYIHNEQKAYYYVNGIRVGTTDSTCNNALRQYVWIGRGAWDSDPYMVGHINEFRVSDGIARWTANFTPPTGNYSVDSYTKILLHFDNTPITSAVSSTDWQIVGTPEPTITALPALTSTDIIKYGKSLYLDGNYYLAMSNEIIIGGNEDFTIEFYGYLDTSGGQAYGMFVALYPDYSSNGNGRIFFSRGNNENRLALGIDTIGDPRISNTVCNTLYHIAIVYHGDSKIVEVYIDGTLQYSRSYTIESRIRYLALGGSVSSYAGHHWIMKGYIDEFRLSNIARYNNNFTVATTAYDLTSPTLIGLPATSVGFTGEIAIPTTNENIEVTYSGIEIGSYTVELRLKDTVRYCWTDGTIAPRNFTYSVTKTNPAYYELRCVKDLGSISSDVIVDFSSINTTTQNEFIYSDGVFMSGPSSYNVNNGQSNYWIKVIPTKDMKVYVRAKVGSEGNYDYGLVSVATSRSIPGRGASSITNGSIIYKNAGVVESVVSANLTANTTYYIGFHYAKDGSVNNNGDRFWIYNTAFTLPTSIMDLCGNVWNTTGTYQTSTEITKFGNSLYLDGSSYLQIPNNVVNFFGDNYEFTIDWWEYRTTDINYGGAVLSFRESVTSTSNNNFSITLGWINKSLAGNYVNININNDKIYEHAGDIILNEWVHRAIVKKDSHYYCFQNGSLFADITSSVNPTYNSNYALATTASYNNCSRFQGYIDELRISNIARWTSNFTPPTSQYSKDNNTKVLLHF